MNDRNIQQSTINRITDSISKQDSYRSAKHKFEKYGHLTAGAQRALDQFYTSISFKKGLAKRVGIDKRNRAYAISRKNGKRISTKPYKRFINKLRKKE